MKTIKVALLGLGTVGSGVVKILKENSSKIVQNAGSKFIITKALIRNPQKYENKFDNLQLTTEFNDIVNDDDLDIVVEVMGEIHPAEEYIEALLKKGKSVVSANKDLIATKGEKLIKLAQENNANFLYEASVAGGIPILRNLSVNYSGDQIEEISGIVNGTTNYILTQMKEEELDFEDALKKAQELGFAEADPTNDVTGKDAAFKMVILTDFAFGTKVTLDQVSYKGIEKVDSEEVDFAAQTGYTIKLIGTSRRVGNKLLVEVSPKLVKKSSQLASVSNEFNAIEVKSKYIGQSFFYGPGAGSLPTANSVVSDLIQEAKHLDKAEAFNSFDNRLEVVKNIDENRVYFVSIQDGTDKYLYIMNHYLGESLRNTLNRLMFFTPKINLQELAKLEKLLHENKVDYSIYQVME
ncbi:homoserine dehydrogenase [Lactobacillus kalixensis]|uniref:Homoserine dehydrogenase n=1 Tax=Lactobacillus kalixensis DSM 16043 TaxID=1423763 RepID=A0A0R1UB29_9LACO|nr:homoserine dehydrogenase [Lactobacillus kalixensis]KRL90583.1 homoserine dehydrogenase [Lactobacillus kalixensis DSM 16043]